MCVCGNVRAHASLCAHHAGVCVNLCLTDTCHPCRCGMRTRRRRAIKSVRPQPTRLHALSAEPQWAQSTSVLAVMHRCTVSVASALANKDVDKSANARGAVLLVHEGMRSHPRWRRRGRCVSVCARMRMFCCERTQDKVEGACAIIEKFWDSFPTPSHLCASSQRKVTRHQPPTRKMLLRRRPKRRSQRCVCVCVCEYYLWRVTKITRPLLSVR